MHLVQPHLQLSHTQGRTGHGEAWRKPMVRLVQGPVPWGLWEVTRYKVPVLSVSVDLDSSGEQFLNEPLNP